MKSINLHFSVIIICLLLLTGNLFAQQSKNPFELTLRIAPEQVEKTTPQVQNPFDIVEKEANDTTPTPLSNEEIITEEDTPIGLEVAPIPPSTSNNPFEKITSESANTPTPIKEIEKTSLDNIAKVSSNYNPKLLNGVIFFVLVLLALLASLFRSTLNKSFQAFFNDNLLGQYYREQNSGVTIPYLFFYILFLLNTGIFVFLLLRYFNINALPNEVSGIIGTILVVSGILLLKLLVLWLMGNIYPVEKETKLYSFTVIIFSIVSGILLIPANILLAYASEEIIQYAIYAVFIGLGIIYLLRSLRGVFIANRFLLFHKFHFLLYICTIEIAPAIILFKFI